MPRRASARPSRAALLAALLAAAACNAGAERDERAHEAAEAAAAMPAPVEPAEQAAPPADGDVPARAYPAEPPALRVVAAEPVHGRTGPGGVPFEVALRSADRDAAPFRRIGTRTFGVSLRADGLTHYPCTSCHIPGIAAPIRDRPGDAHADLQVVHPAETGAACTTCHAPDVARLALETGETVSLDHAYRLCAQCHFAQVDAWAGGSHGKRLDGWYGRRVVLGCTACHDPHRPVTPVRIPFQAPRIPRTGSR